MLTRKQYMDNEVSHYKYYSQFYDTEIERLILNTFTKEYLLSKYNDDSNLNNIPLSKWDDLSLYLSIDNKIREVGDTPTLAVKVCVLKNCAVRLIS